jgi:hypothetical protein
MPLNRALEQFLNEHVTDEQARSDLRRYFERFPELQKRFEGYLRQEDYDRMMNEVKRQREKEQQMIEEWKQRVQKWEEWVAENVPKHEQLLSSYQQLLARNQEIEAENARLRAMAERGEQRGEGLESTVRSAAEEYSGYYGNTHVDPDDLARRVMERVQRAGYVTKEEISRIAAEEAKKKIEEASETLFKKTLPTYAEQLLKVAELRERHMQEFGKPLDWRELARFAVKNNMADLDAAYEAFTQKDRLEKETQRIREEVRKELLSQQLPGAAVPPNPEEIGPLRARMQGLIPPELENAELGTGQLAALAAAELRREGKG